MKLLSITFLTLALLTIQAALPKVAEAQFTAAPNGAAQAAPAPVSDAFKTGFLDGHRGMATNLGVLSPSTPLKAHANTGKGDLADAAQDFRDAATRLRAGWAGADDAARGKIAGAVEAATQSAQIYAHQLAESRGISVPNHTTETGYFSSANAIYGSEEHAERLLTDTAEILDTINGGIAGDKQKSAGGKIADSNAAGMVPGLNVVHFGRASKQVQKNVAVANANNAASSIHAISMNLISLYLPPSEPATPATPGQKP